MNCRSWLFIVGCRGYVHESNGATEEGLTLWGVSHLYFYHSFFFKVMRSNSWLLLLLLLLLLFVDVTSSFANLYFHIPKWFQWPLHQMRYVLYAILDLCVHRWTNKRNHNRINNELRWKKCFKSTLWKKYDKVQIFQIVHALAMHRIWTIPIDVQDDRLIPHID